MSALRRLLPAFAIAIATADGGAQSDSSDSEAIEAAQFARLKAAVTAKDRQAIARLFVYPTRVNRPSASPFWIRSSAELLSRFDSVLTPEIRRVIVAQRSDSLVQSWRGTMVGNGALWIAGVCEDGRVRRCRYGVIAINLPSPRPPGEAARRGERGAPNPTPIRIRDRERLK